MRVGCPIRISTDQRLLAAPHGFSQRATSFIASWCQGIHRMPLSCSRRLSRTEVQELHHAQKPSSEDGRQLSVFCLRKAGRQALRPASLAVRRPPTDNRCLCRIICSAHNRSIASTRSFDPKSLSTRRIFRSKRPQWNLHASEHLHHRRRPKPPVRQLRRQRPETHQNLIHPDKEHAPPRGDANSTAARFVHPTPAVPITFASRDTQPIPRVQWWRRSDSNRRPPACKAGALPAELRPRQSLVFSLQPSNRKLKAKMLPFRRLTTSDLRLLVGQGGFEPPTPRLSSVCSNQLSY